MGLQGRGIDGSTIVNHLREPVFFIDESRSLTFGNDRFFAVTQLSSESLGDGADLLEQFLPEDYDAFREAVDGVLAGETTDCRIDVTMHHPEEAPSPATLPVEARLVPVEEPPGVLVTLRNISDRTEYERKLEAKTEQLIVLNRLLRHDVSNDVGVIEGWADLMAEESDADRDLIDRIKAAASHIQDLTRETSDVLQIFEEEGELERVPIPVVETLRTEIEKTHGTHPEATITGPEPDALQGLEVCANVLLGSVFTNVLTNAIIHHDRKHPAVTATVERRDDTAVVRILDDGPGIPDERKALILDEDRTLDDANSGIGTYLVTKLVAEFGGEVSVSDNEPRGTVVTIELPVAEDGCDGD